MLAALFACAYWLVLLWLVGVVVIGGTFTVFLWQDRKALRR